jgi:Zn-dependent protease with chaperone function
VNKNILEEIMIAQKLRTSKEKNLFAISFVVSLIAWIALIATIIGIVYGIFFGLFLFFAHALMISYIKGHGVKLSEKQFPEIYARVVSASHSLGLKSTPEVYLMQAGGALNAFATKMTGRNFVVIYSDLLEACGDEGKEIDMIIGHEVGHLVLGHLKWRWFLVPSRIVPLLGAAYSRACEYSADLCGFEVVGELEAATRGLAILAAGGKYGKLLDIRSFVFQSRDTGGFWASVYELNATHPYLPKRIAALFNNERPGIVPVTQRNFLAYPLAPFFGFASAGGSAPLVMIATVGILAAVAIPQFEAYRNKAEMATMDTTLVEICKTARNYSEINGHWPCSEAELAMPQVSALMASKNWKLESDCQNSRAYITFKKNESEHYKAIDYRSGEIQDGPTH